MMIPSAWLRASDCDLVEVRTSDHDRLVDVGLTADAALIVLDPYRLASDDIILALGPVIASSRPIVVVVNGPLPESTTETIATASIVEHFTALGSGAPRPTVAFVDTSLALKALDALYDGLQEPDAPSSIKSKSFEVFQHAYLKSRVGPLQSVLNDLVGENHRYRTVLSTVALATRRIAALVNADEEAMLMSRRAIKDLRDHAVRTERHAHTISVISRALDGGLVEGGVDDQVWNARRDIEAMFHGRFAWTSLLWRLRVDDVGADLGGYIAQRFGAELEEQVSRAALLPTVLTAV